MSRFVSVVLLVAVVLLTGAGLVWYFAYGLNERPPRTASVEGLGADVEVQWYAEDAAAITASAEADAYAALGYVHGQTRTWTVALWRQTALGTLGTWFGEDVLPIDRFVHRIGLPAAARAAYAALPPEERDLLDAYARGMDAALRGRQARTHEGLARLDVTPEPWAPWHTLAVERLYAWLATTPPDTDTLAAGADAAHFFADDRRLRDWLRVYGFESGIAWAVTDSAGTYFFQRHVQGASTQPIYQEIRLAWMDGPRLTGLSLPGTPFFPAAMTDERAWAFFPTGTARMYRTPDTTAAAARHFTRLRTFDGAEHLLAVRRTGDALLFDAPPTPPAPDTVRAGLPRADTLGAAVDLATPIDSTALPPAPDTTWALTWPGFGTASDAAAWRQLLHGETSSFRLVGGFGLVVQRSGATAPLGTPPITIPLGESGLFVGGAPWTAYAGGRLDSLRMGGAAPPAWRDDDLSLWAATLAPVLVASIDSIDGLRPHELVEDALTYLRNWDFRYTRTSIAATIFDSWVTTYRDTTGRLPDVTVPDTVFFEDQRRYAALVQAVSQLHRRFGAELESWRWENAMPDERVFPVWSADTLLAQRPAHLARTHYAPIVLPGMGHPTTLAWGSSPVFLDTPAPAAFEMWITTARWGEPEVRRRRFDLDRFLGRYRTLRRQPAFTAPFEREPARTTTLRAAGT